MGTHPIFESDFDCLTDKQDIMADKTEKAVDLGILEEDDEFEEFPAEDWKEVTDTDPKNDAVWECNWEDEDNFDDFNHQLRAELEAKGNKLAPVVDSKPEPKE